MFIKYNHNPKQKKTSDCVIRAISLGTNKSWEAVYTDLTQLGLKKYLMPNADNVWKEYLKQLGYEKQAMPRKENNTRYTVDEFCNEIAKSNTTYIISIANHLTVVKDRNIYDTWNYGKKCVGNYWITDDTNKPKVRVEL